MKRFLIRALPMLMVVPFAQAQNDECAGAIAIGAGVTAYDTTGATTSAPAWPCALGGTDLWFSYTAGGLPENVVVDTCNGNTGYDSALEAFDSCGGASVACNDDTCGLQSQIGWTQPAGSTYVFRVGGFNSGSGTGELTLTATPNAPTTFGDDDCANAEAISGDGTWSIDNEGATTGAEGQNEANCYKFSTSAVQSDVWVLWTPTVSGSVTMDTCADGGTNADTKMAAYPGPDCPADGTSLDCNDDTCGLRSTISFNVCCGDSYLIQLGSFPGSADGTFTLTAVQSGVSCGGGVQRWSQNVDNTTITPGNSVSCNAGGLHTNNSYYRRYEATDVGLGAGSGFTATAVDFGVELAAAASGSQSADVNAYSIPNGSALTLANLNPLDSASLTIADGSGFFVNTPISASVPAGSDLVLEIFTPDGQTLGNSLFVGSNSLGQTAPCYIAAADCAIVDPVDIAAVGFPDMHLILDVTTGAAGDPVIGCNYCGPAVPNSAGLSGVITATGDNTAGASFTLAASNLPPGAFGIFISGPSNGEFAPATSNGIFCLKGGDPGLLGRFFPPFMADAAGAASISVDSGAIPTADITGATIAMTPGVTWYFQCYYRDGARTNFTDATAILFE